MAPISIPEVTLTSGHWKMPALGLGTVAFPVPEPEIVIKSIIDAIELGYRHFDTASAYRTEEPMGEAISQALARSLIQSRDQVFITTKLWVNDAHADCVLPALQKSLQNLKMEYVDQYLIHWPVSMKRGPIQRTSSEDMLPLDIKSVWTAMEECQTLGLAKSIGVCNFTIKKLTHLLSFAKIPPAINQFEMNAAWQQKKLNELCKANGIMVAAYMPLGAAGNAWGTNRVMESEVLKEIASAKGKSVAQVALRWIHQQGAVVIVKSFNKERMKQNMEIFDWELSDEENKKIGEIPQVRTNVGTMFLSPTGTFKSIEELWDGEL